VTSVNENVAFNLMLLIAQSLLSVPAASTASERAFSLAGCTMEEEMSATNPKVSMDCCLFTDRNTEQWGTFRFRTRVNSKH